MKRLKYHPRVGENHGKNRIKEEWLKEHFGEQYKLVWNGHSHFALDENNGSINLKNYVFFHAFCIYLIYLSLFLS